MNLFQMVFVPFCAIFALAMLYGVKRGKLSRLHGLVWATVWTLGAVLIAVPNSSTVMAKSLGIGRGTDLVFYLAILFGLGACLYFYGRYRRLEIIVTELIRREAMTRPERGADDETMPQSEDDA